ncbi:hypothetical protein [Helicobacter pylori]|uniref:hypothetical protein n=1 Tax=Helicobacter pylori TaxID=210 RepID=UPI00095894C0|nr:hypothetical protein [Helicobacter pylori]BAW78695.1 hP0423 family protein [Helicobacter pylori]
MGFQNENQLKVGALVKATINGKVVEAKVISIGFNRVTLRSEKGNEVSYAFNSEKFLKWFKQVPLDAVKSHAEKSGEDLLKGIKIVTSGPTIKQRVTTPKEKEDRFKLAFGFKTTDDKTSFEILAEDYTLSERKSRLGALLTPLFFEGRGNQVSAIVITALAHAKDLNKHSDAKFNNMIENRDTEDCIFDSFDNMGMGDVFTFCKAMEVYALNSKKGDKNGISLEEWAWLLPKDKKEAKFVAQLLCDGGINKYGLSCAGLAENLLKDVELTFGLATHAEIDENLAKLEKEGEVE